MFKCQKRKKIKPKSKQIFPNGPLDRIVADTCELPEYLKIKTQYAWVLDIIDYFSKYILSYPLILKNADNILIGIKEIIFENLNKNNENNFK